MMLAALDTIIARLEGDIATETAIIAEMVAAKQIGNGCGYWKKRHGYECRLRAATDLRAALQELVAQP